MLVQKNSVHDVFYYGILIITPDPQSSDMRHISDVSAPSAVSGHQLALVSCEIHPIPSFTWYFV